eukprot:4744208-Pleurochrysis_carterae.AAC.3
MIGGACSLPLKLPRSGCGLRAMDAIDGLKGDLFAPSISLLEGSMDLGWYCSFCERQSNFDQTVDDGSSRNWAMNRWQSAHAAPRCREDALLLVGVGGGIEGAPKQPQA